MFVLLYWIWVRGLLMFVVVTVDIFAGSCSRVFHHSFLVSPMLALLQSRLLARHSCSTSRLVKGEPSCLACDSANSIAPRFGGVVILERSGVRPPCLQGSELDPDRQQPQLRSHLLLQASCQHMVAGRAQHMNYSNNTFTPLPSSPTDNRDVFLRLIMNRTPQTEPLAPELRLWRNERVG